ncbi:MAG: F0F1 ATP synthase subunit delta [Clostridia bacterium]|nr:F0F1 ATP synthase subunit delta [Clostridia bacterium]
MLKGAIGERYAEALYDLAKGLDKAEDVEQELLAVKDIVEKDRDLQKILYHPRITAEEKKELLQTLFQGKIAEVTFSFLPLLVDKQREQYLCDIVDAFVLKANEDRNILAAEISSAVALSDSEKAGLKKVLTKVTGRDMVTEFAVDPELMGGVVVKIGDRVIDGSLKTRFAAMREYLRQN